MTASVLEANAVRMDATSDKETGITANTPDEIGQKDEVVEELDFDREALSDFLVMPHRT